MLCSASPEMAKAMGRTDKTFLASSLPIKISAKDRTRILQIHKASNIKYDCTQYT
jgi:hypothetical protein